MRITPHYFTVLILLRTADAKLLETVGKILEYCFVLGLCSWRRLFEGENQETNTYEHKYNSRITNKNVGFLNR